jgi:hypothetical protein
MKRNRFLSQNEDEELFKEITEEIFEEKYELSDSHERKELSKSTKRYQEYHNHSLGVGLSAFYYDGKMDSEMVIQAIADIQTYLDDLKINKPVMFDNTKKNRIHFLKLIDVAIMDSRLKENDLPLLVAYRNINRDFIRIKGDDRSFKAVFSRESTFFNGIKGTRESIADGDIRINRGKDTTHSESRVDAENNEIVQTLLNELGKQEERHKQELKQTQDKLELMAETMSKMMGMMQNIQVQQIQQSRDNNSIIAFRNIQERQNRQQAGKNNAPLIEYVQEKEEIKNQSTLQYE